MERTPLLEIEGLKKYYPIEAGISKKKIGEVKAVDNVNLTIYKNEVLGVVGESGCGKTTLGRTVLRIIEPTDGKVKFHFDGKEIDFTALDKKELRQMRRHLQMIFQNPYTSLNPRMTIFDIVAEPMRLGGGFTEDEISERVKTLINKVGLEVKHLNRYPHAFSGGQRQRIGIARALVMDPQFVVADEAVSALDVSIQAQILNLLKELKDENNLTYMFIAHNLSVVEHVSDRVCVMYLGRVVEMAEKPRSFSIIPNTRIQRLCFRRFRWRIPQWKTTALCFPEKWEMQQTFLLAAASTQGANMLAMNARKRFLN